MEFPFYSNYWNYPPHHWSGAEPPAMNLHHWPGVETPAMNRQTRCPFPREPRRNRTEVEAPAMNRQTRSPFPESSQTGMEIPTAKNQARTQVPKAASKVVDIPVRFVGSETMKTTAVVKIQKVFRGFLVRKSVKKIDAIRKEVDEIERRVSEKETILMMRRDAKERLKVNEMLMALLFRLDSIRGVDSGVRDFRKSVIKKAIMLQERVDAIVSGDIEMVDTGETMQMQQVQEEDCGADSPEPIAEIVDQTIEIKGSENVVDENMKANHHVESEPCNPLDYEPVMEEAGDQASELQQVPDEYNPNDCETTVQSQDKFHSASEVEVENLKEEEEEDPMDIQQQPELVQAENLEVVEGGGEKKVVEESSSNNRDLMERMIKGNEMLTSLVTELCDRQESHSRLLSSLSQRVENLEKAFRCERSKRKKKRHTNINKS